MSQAEQHALYVEVAFEFGWTLWDEGVDNSCLINPDRLVPIWMKPVAWDREQMVPVGCLCCTDLDAALVEWHAELGSVNNSEAQRLLDFPIYSEEVSIEAEALAPAPDWMNPNIPR